MSETKPLSFLEVLKSGLPEMKVVTDQVSQQQIEIFADPTVEKEIAELVHQYFLEPMWPAAISFCRGFYTCFYGDRRDVIPDVIKSMTQKQWRITEDYLLFFQHLIQDAAAVGFPSLLEPFGETRKDLILLDTQRSPFDARNIFALKIYLNDILFEITQVRIKETKSLLKKRNANVSLFPKLSINVEIAAAWGSFPTINAGLVSKVLPPPKERYDRHQVPIYIPDMSSVKNTLEIARFLGRTRQSNRTSTYKVIGAMSEFKARSIFPDFLDSNVSVSQLHRKMVESAFGLSYESAREMIQSEFEYDAP